MVCASHPGAPGKFWGVPYQVHTPVFEGPFDLLLHLIAREQVDLYEVSLSRIVDAYLAELSAIGVGGAGAGPDGDPGVALDLEVATEFLVIAATLVELKTRRLLPSAAAADIDDELALFEERDLLLARLLECKTFRDAGAALARLADLAGRSRPRTAGLEERFLALAPDVLAGVTPAMVHAAMVRAVAPRPPPPRIDLDHVAPVRVSVRDAVDELVGSLASIGHTSFRSLTDGIDVPLEVIVRFLAILELYKEGLVELEQASTFGELEITWLGEAGTDRLVAASGGGPGSDLPGSGSGDLYG